MVDSVPPKPIVRGLRSATVSVIGRLPSGRISGASTKRIEEKTPSRFSRSCPVWMSSGSNGLPSGRLAMKAMKAGSTRRLPVTLSGP